MTAKNQLNTELLKGYLVLVLTALAALEDLKGTWSS